MANMASVKQILLVLLSSAILIGLMGLWIHKTSEPTETILGSETQLEGPLTSEELEVNNPEITNTMNRIAVFDTNMGTIEIELFENQMPITTGNFAKLITEKFYDGTKFHRVIDGFMIQGGDPNTKGDNVASYGTGGPGYTIQDEFVAGELLTNKRGTIAMANTGQPNSGGSQFFINTVDNLGLDYDKDPAASKHPVFGRVITGMDIVDKISNTPVNERDLPKEAVVIKSVTLRNP